MAPLSSSVSDFIKAEAKKINEDLFRTQHKIWQNPELCYEEIIAHDTLTSFMSSQPGWKVTPHVYGINTAFLCEFTHKPSQNPTVVSFNSEYDALPGVGHACGHNLIAICGVAGAIATALAMKRFDIPGTVKLFGTPAEEGGGGKIKLIDAGAYEGVDVSLMAHPFNQRTSAYGWSTAGKKYTLEYLGKEAHAAAAPWQGINALDAAVVFYDAASVLRQQLKPGDIIQYSISDGGKAPNIITAHTSIEFTIRAPTLGRMLEVEEKIRRCAQAGALATGCKFKITENPPYSDMICNDVLCEMFSWYMSHAMDTEMLPLDDDREAGRMSASTDQGNVSYVVPSIQPLFFVKSPEGGPHSKVFTKAAGTEAAHTTAVGVGLSLSCVALELLQSREKLDDVKKSFEKDVQKAKTLQVSVASDLVDDLTDLLEDFDFEFISHADASLQ